MRTAHKLNRDVLWKLDEVRDAMERLIGAVPDPTDRMLIRSQMDDLEFVWREFALHHFGINMDCEND